MFQYEHPQFLHLLWAVPLLALLLLAYGAWRKRTLNRLGAPGPLQRVMPGFSPRRFWLKNLLILMALAGLILAWANPQRGSKKQQTTQKSADVFIALDISQSMLARDQAPSRLELSKVFIRKAVKALQGERIGLIFFAGDAFLQMPLSTDYAFIIQSVQDASPDLITAQGTAVPAAIDLAIKSFGNEPAGRALILITDGENHDEDAVGRAEAAFDDGIVIFPVGAGTAEGGPIPTADSEFSEYKRDEDGEQVITKLNESLLHDIAQAAGGRVFNVGKGDAAISALKREIDGLEKRDIAVRSFSEFESYYQWFLLPGLLLLVLEGWLGWRRRDA